MPRCHQHLICTIGVLLVASATHAQETVRSGSSLDAQVASELMKSSEKLIADGEQALAKGAFDEAGRTFGQALRRYEQIATAHPEWHPRLVGSRIEYCNEQIEQVVTALVGAPEDAAAAGTEPPSPEPPRVVASPTPPPDDVDALGEELPRPGIARPVAVPMPVAPGSEPEEEERLLIGDDGEAVPPDEPGMEEPSRRGGFFGWMRRNNEEAESDGVASNATVDAATPATETATNAVETVSEANPPAPVPTAGYESMDSAFLRNAVVRMLKEGAATHARDLLLDQRGESTLNVEQQLLLGICYCHTGQFEEAAGIAKKIVLSGQENARAHVLLSTAYLGLGDIDIARDQLLLALEIDASLGQAHYNLCRLLVSISPPNLPGARWHYRRARALGEPADPALERQLE